MNRALIETVMRSCGDKRQFRTMEDAERFVRLMRWAGKVAGEVAVYRCQFCSAFHWGHPPRRTAA